ncbi:hypothetical protein JNO12_05580 [Erwinia aphidicola]|nr:hypothetical protein [Erwinia aphidicola]
MMSINLGLDGLRKAVIRASLFLNDLPGETHSLGNAMFQQRVALTASATRTRNATRNSKSALKASKERLQEIRITEALERPQRARDNLNKAQQRFTLGQSKVQQRYQAGQGVVDKIGAVSGQAMSVARQGGEAAAAGLSGADGAARCSNAGGGTIACRRVAAHARSGKRR